MSTDPLTQVTALVAGEYKKQTGPFTATTLDNKNYVLYASSIDVGNGGDHISLCQAAVATGGATTVTCDENDNGIQSPESVQTINFSIAANGRMSASGGKAPVFYLADTTLAFVVGADTSALSGYLEQQTGGPFSTASISGQFFFGAPGPTTGTSDTSGIINLVVGSPNGTLTGTADGSDRNGLKLESISGDTYCFSTSSCTPATTALGQGNVGSGSIAYIISPSKVVFMQMGGTTPQNSRPPGIYIGQK